MAHKKEVTVADLIKDLKTCDQNRIVVMSSDPEGNNYSSLHEISNSAYNPITGEVGLEKLTPDLKKMGYSNEDVIDGGKPCVVLYPR